MVAVRKIGSKGLSTHCAKDVRFSTIADVPKIAAWVRREITHLDRRQDVVPPGRVVGPAFPGFVYRCSEFPQGWVIRFSIDEEHELAAHVPGPALLQRLGSPHEREGALEPHGDLPGVDQP